MAPNIELTAEAFGRAQHALQSDEEQRKILPYFKTCKGEYGEGDVFIGVRMGSIFELAKAHMAMPPAEIETLLENPIHEVRVGAVSIGARHTNSRRRSTADTSCQDMDRRRQSQSRQ